MQQLVRRGSTSSVRSRRTVKLLASAGGKPVLGFDDFVIRRRHSYNVILIGRETHWLIDLLPNREAQMLAVWLTAHTSVEIVSRDRGRVYAEGVRASAPSACLARKN